MRMCVVTDIHGQPAADHCISDRLSCAPDVIRFALNELCGRSDLTGEALHRHLFVEGAFDKAVASLKERLTAGMYGLGYSAGGAAIWRAAAEGLPFAAIFCVSSTRLRNEAPITIPNHVFFGAEDPNKPSPNWLATVPDQATVFEKAGHSYYLQTASDAVHKTCGKISQEINGLPIYR